MYDKRNYELVCKDAEIEVTPNHAFANDKLNRTPIAIQMTNMVEAFASQGAVIALDGEWGAGKTTFAKMWRQSLLDEGYKALYFNAWETDHIDDPLVALLGELKEVFDSNEKFKKVIQASGKIITKIVSCAAKSFIKNAVHIDCDDVIPAIDAGLDEAEQLCIARIDDYNQRKFELETFKKKLSEFAASNTSEHPLVFIIDELDRCNPHYAIKLLERIKHLFEVPNIIFVLTTNIQQLQHSVCGFYGSDSIDGKEYLRRFIDLEILLPRPNYDDYMEYLYSRHSFKQFFKSQSDNSSDNEEMFKRIAADLLSASNVNLRTANKIFAYTRLSLTGTQSSSNMSFDLYFLLCFLKVTNVEFYDKIKNHEYTVQQLVNSLETELPASTFSNDDGFRMHHICWAIGSLLLRYNYDSHGLPFEKDFKGTQIEGTDKSEYPIQTSLIDKERLFEALNYKERSRRYFYGLSSILNKIDLLECLRW
jgi:hypothetical protein